MTLREVYSNHTQNAIVDFPIFKSYHQQGCSLTRLAAAGGIHFLLLIAACKKTAACERMNSHTVDAICHSLRHPRGNASDENNREYHMYEQIRDTLIPLLNSIRLNVPLSFSLQGEKYDGGDISATDVLFESIRQKYECLLSQPLLLKVDSNFKLMHRDTESWACFYPPSTPLQQQHMPEPPVRSPSTSSTSVKFTSPEQALRRVKCADVVIDISFDLQAARNKQTPFSAEQVSRQTWTEQQREKAERAVEPLSEQQLRTTVSGAKSTKSFLI